MYESTNNELAQVLAGEADAIGAFVDTMTPVIQTRVARCLLNVKSADLRHDVEDFCQDVFEHLFANDAKALRLWQAERGLSLKNFVGLIAARRTIASLRSSKRNPWREKTPLDEAPTAATTHGGPERTTMDQDELAALLARLREELTPLGWTMFQLLYVYEKSTREIQLATGMSADSVYAWRSRLRQSALACYSAMTDVDAQGRRLRR